MSRELMQQALEALEEARNKADWIGMSEEGWDKVMQQVDEYVTHRINPAITALRERLAQPEQEPDMTNFKPLIERLRDLENNMGSAIYEDAQTCGEAANVIEKLLGRLAQPEQEPVAWHHPECKGECIACLIQRAVQDEYGTQGLDYLLRHVTPVATPPRREWVGLTDEEYSQLHDGFHQQGKLLGWVVDQVEAKLREKNA